MRELHYDEEQIMRGDWCTIVAPCLNAHRQVPGTNRIRRQPISSQMDCICFADKTAPRRTG
jgi:hypothetical protein